MTEDIDDVEVIETVEVDGKRYVPPGWNDLDREMLMRCYTMMGLPAMKGADTEVPWKRIMQASWICGWTTDFVNKWKQDCIDNSMDGDDDGEEQYLIELNATAEAITSKMWQEVSNDDPDDFSARKKKIATETKVWTINLGLTKCPWPELVINGMTYYAAEDEWKNLTWWELTMLWEHINEYLHAGNEEVGDYILAILYRPSKEETQINIDSGYEGDRRQPLLNHESKIKERAKGWVHVHPVVKHVLMFWSVCCRQAIYEEYSDVFGGGDVGNYTGPVESGLQEVMMDLADNVSDIDKVAEQNIHNILLYIRRKNKIKPRQ